MEINSNDHCVLQATVLSHSICILRLLSAEQGVATSRGRSLNLSPSLRESAVVPAGFTTDITM